MSEQPAAAPAAQPGNIVDPYRQYNFKLVIQGVVQGHFTRVDPFEINIPRILHREGTDRATVTTLMGPVEYPPVTLRYGLTESREMWRWLFKAVSGEVDRRNVSIVLLNEAGTAEVRRWNLVRAWPCNWRSPSLKALGSGLAIEHMTLAYDRLELDDAGAVG
ncbi:phage tail protein [Paenarthrobacter sp. PH39-S1]|uniref:phage tail protein n=1 Tax=Paenarthrobacter sp. PH39-S1 TaxID=3046204 RepID=UPI0024BB7A53|nr:phage tail protein [Paenarthrobacter sp. PH39-S1]MDJ0355994.1 phage tail protein [Paenarthrobacter sp. PH39-S1]